MTHETKDADDGSARTQDVNGGRPVEVTVGDGGTDREAHLARRRAAQFTVPEDRMVEAVEEVLSRHGP